LGIKVAGAEVTSKFHWWQTILMFLIVALHSQKAAAQPMPMVLVEDTQDRWITFDDGSRLSHGYEITPLLNESLYESGRYLVVAGDEGPDDGPAAKSLSLMSQKPSFTDLLIDRLPDVKFDYLDHVIHLSQASAGVKVFAQIMSLPAPKPQIIIRPRVTSILYASGERSDRIVYGFSPDRLNPYNAGMPGYKDNEFTATEYGQPDPVSGQVCENVDFFGGQLNPLGWGPGLSNFGANSDEGLELFLFGYGFGFKKKSYEVKSEISFDVEIPQLNQKKQFDYQLKGSGKDVSVSVSYQGLNVGFELARVKTLRMALQAILTDIVDNFIKDIPATAWSTSIAAFQNNQWIIPAGTAQGVTTGLKLVSSFGSQYTVTQAFNVYSVVTPDPSNRFKPFVQEVLGLTGDSQPAAERGSVRTLAVAPSQSRDLGKLDLPDAVEPQDVPPPVSDACMKKAPGTWQRLVMGIMWLYGYVRYKTVFDQPYDKAGVSAATDKVAILGSGIDPKDGRLKNALDASGFDFISWDSRPSDDLGMGTAAAVLLKKKYKNAPPLVPLKVLTPFGLTHSSAIYEALTYAANRDDIAAVLIPFKPLKDSQALRDGVQALVKKGKTVIVPEGIDVPGAVQAPPTKEFKTDGLGGADIRLSAVGSGVVEKFVEILSSKNK
jgi:hypothetical protein